MGWAAARGVWWCAPLAHLFNFDTGSSMTVAQTPEQAVLAKGSAENMNRITEMRDAALRSGNDALRRAAEMVETNKRDIETLREAESLAALSRESAAVAGGSKREIARADYALRMAEAAAARRRRTFIHQLAREMTDASLLSLAVIAFDPLEPSASRIAAQEKILDRGIGKVIPMTPLPEDISELPAADAITKLIQWVGAGIIPQAEIVEHTRLIEMKVKAVELVDMQRQIDLLTGAAPTINATPAASAVETVEALPAPPLSPLDPNYIPPQG